MGSRVLKVLDNWLDLTIQTSTRPRQNPALKKEVCEDIRFALLRPAMGSRLSRASRGNVITWRSVTHQCYLFGLDNQDAYQREQ
jgi:hypothetical protein